jgi:hypothetical protein
MAKAKPKVSTIKQAVKAYRGKAAFARSFGLTLRSGYYHSLGSWYRAGVPRAHHLGLYVGLERRGYGAQPKLFGLTSWKRCLGVKP